jgi:hypothetical protein
MTYVMGVSDARENAVGHGGLNNKRPNKVLVIKKDEIMKPF